MLIHDNVFYISDPATMAVVTGGYTLIIDKKTLKIVGVVPEHPVLKHATEVVQATTALLRETESSQGVEPMRADAAKLLVSLVDAITSEVIPKSVDTVCRKTKEAK